MGSLPRVTEIQRVTILNPFRADVAKWFSISANHCQLIEVIKVFTDSSNVIGFGETMVDYIAVPYPVTDEGVQRVIGSEVSEFIFDDTVGAGLQMALLDATGKALEQPAWKIFASEKFREACPVSWWNMEAPADVLAREAGRAVEAGYLSHKIKARPWFDIHKQVKAINEVTPDNYLIDIDWNGQLLDFERAKPVISELNRYGKIGLYEDPIPRDDLQGQLHLKEYCQRPLLTHYFEEWSPNQMCQGTVDGYVIDGGISRILRIGSEIEEYGLEGFIQICGTGLTVALSLHLGAVVKGAKHPYVSMYTSFSEEILVNPLVVSQGLIKVPDGPGLGVEVSEEQLEKLRFFGERPLGVPRRVYRFHIGDGRSKSYAKVEQLWADSSLSGSMPVQPNNSFLEIMDDDGTSEFDKAFEKLKLAPIWD